MSLGLVRNVIDDSDNALLKVFQRLWIRLLKVYDDLEAFIGNGNHLICIYKGTFKWQMTVALHYS